MSIKKEIIMKATINYDNGGAVNVKIKGYDKVFHIYIPHKTIISESEQVRLMFNAVMTQVFNELVLGINQG